MPDLTNKERELISRHVDTAIVRPVEQWMTILRDLPIHDAAARIFGDLLLYRVRNGWDFIRRDGFLSDVQQLANALKAMSELAHAQHDITED